MTSRFGCVRILLALVVALGALAGCGVPRNDVPQAVESTAVPFGLLDPRLPDAPTTPAGERGLVYFLNAEGRLTAVPRRVNGYSRPADLVRELLAGPRSEEAARGLTSAVPARTRLLSLDVTGTVATLDLSREFGDVSGGDQVDAVAQLVYTVTQSPQIDAVLFSVEGQQIEVPDGTGSLSLLPVTRQDYAASTPSPAPPSTRSPSPRTASARPSPTPR